MSFARSDSLDAVACPTSAMGLDSPLVYAVAREAG